MLVLIKKLLLYIFKKITKWCIIFFLFCFIVKCYYFIFLGYYFLNEELFYNINIYFLYLILFFTTLYFRFILSFFIKSDTILFYHTIYFYSLFKEIKNTGFTNFLNTKKKQYLLKLKLKIKNYWEFRRKLSPLNKKINITTYDAIKKYYVEVERLKKLKLEEKIKKFREKRKNWHKLNFYEYSLYVQLNLNIAGVSKKKKYFKAKEKDEFFFLKPKPLRIIKNSDFFSRYIRWIDNKKNNIFLKIILNIVMSFFALIDLIYLFLLSLFVYNKIIIWKPLNIRLPYFKKIKSKKLKNKCTL